MDRGLVTVIGMSIAYVASFIGMGLAWWAWRRRVEEGDGEAGGRGDPPPGDGGGAGSGGGDPASPVESDLPGGSEPPDETTPRGESGPMEAP